jgi:hypothetical protein
MAGCGAEASPGSATGASPGGPGAARVAPYVDVTLGTEPDLRGALARGIRIFNLAFVTAAPGACRPAWGSGTPYDDEDIAQRIRSVRAAGADVRVSFGGAQSQELAQACPTVPALVAAYRTVIDAYQLTMVDLDIEGAALQDGDAVRRRNLAVRELQTDAQRRGTRLRVSYTLPADSDGLTAPAQELLRDAHDAGVEPEAVNVMTMNFGGGGSDMAAQSMTVASAAEGFVRSLWQRGPGGGAAEGWGMIALTSMIGVNDTPGDVFGPAPGGVRPTAAGRMVVLLVAGPRPPLPAGDADGDGPPLVQRPGAGGGRLHLDLRRLHVSASPSPG